MAHSTRAAAVFLATLAAAALGATPAAAASDLTATTIRIGDHPGFVRAVIDFSDGTLLRPSEMLRATDADPFADGVAPFASTGRACAPRPGRHEPRASPCA